MENKNERRDELQEISPFLAQLKGQDPGFRVPKDYFRSLPDEVLNRVRSEHAPSPETPPGWLHRLAGLLQKSWQPRYALASLVLLLLAGIFYLKNDAATSPMAEVELKNISDKALENYLSKNIDDLSTDLLENHVAENAAAQLPGLETDELEKYLDGELDDLNLDDLEELF